jgi:hypothetical protein
MIKRFFFLISISFISINFLFCSEDSTGYKFSYSGTKLLYTPSKSNLFENRTGLTKDFASSKIRLDIAYSPDFLLLKSSDNSFSLGADFHAFGLLFNESEKIILQVDAIDAIFGGHFSWRKEFDSYTISSRFRILHLSSHLVDGHYNLENGYWKNNKSPMPFGREYADFSACLEYNNFRFNIGSDFIFRQRPDVLTEINPETSAEYRLKDCPGKGSYLYLSGTIKLSGVHDARYLNKTVTGGVSFNINKPIDLFLLFYSGLNYYGEYYAETLRYFGIGFNLELI